MNLRILLAALAASVYMSASADAPAVQWLSTVHDFGAFDEDMGNVTADFRLVNTGDAPLVILAARASCGCTVPSFTKDPVAPGDTATISVTYNPTGRPGKFDKKVKIETNAPEKQTVITIKGSVIGASNTLRARFPIEAGPLKLRRDVVTFGEVYKGRVKTAFLEGYNRSNDSITPSVSSLPPYLRVQVAPKVVPPGEQVTFTLFYDAAIADQWGLNTTDIDVALSAGSAPVPVSVTAIVVEDFSSLTAADLEKAPRVALTPSSLDFGTLSPGHTAEMSLRIDNYGKTPLLIRRLSASAPWITLKLPKDRVKPGGGIDVTVKVDLPADAAMLNERLTLITNDPDRPTATIRLTGESKK